MSVVNKFTHLPSTKRLSPGKEWVYFLRAECPDRLVKIGHSINIKWRLTGLQTQCPVQLSLIGLAKAPAGTEFVFHELLRGSRAHGEWFYPTERLEQLRRGIPKGGQLHFDALIELVEPLGMPVARLQETLAKATQYAKHAKDHGEDQDD